MQVNVAVEDSILVVAIEGRFDAHVVDDFDSSVIQRIDIHRKHVIVDLQRVVFMDSRALATLVRALRSTGSHSGTITLVNLSTPARVILELTRLDAVFTAVSTMRDARDRILQAA